jgi:hypothetical protein
VEAVPRRASNPEARVAFGPFFKTGISPAYSVCVAHKNIVELPKFLYTFSGRLGAARASQNEGGAMRHFSPLTVDRSPALAVDELTLSDCFSYLLETWDWSGFLDCWQEKKGCNCGEPE